MILCGLDCEPGTYGINCVNQCQPCTGTELPCDSVTGECPCLDTRPECTYSYGMYNDWRDVFWNVRSSYLNLNHTIISNFIIVYLLFTTLYRPTYSYLHDRHDCYLCQSRSLCHSVHSFGLTQWIPICHQTYVALTNWMISYDQAGLSDCFVWQCFRHLHSTCLPSSNCISVPRI